MNLRESARLAQGRKQLTHEKHMKVKRRRCLVGEHPWCGARLSLLIKTRISIPVLKEMNGDEEKRNLPSAFGRYYIECYKP